ncbi:MAG: hypothetical protein KIT45_07280 [Fimbriimonadia bacterium]|nr:hypothetical protein [Fimbriimonadia bacterium]
MLNKIPTPVAIAIVVVLVIVAGWMGYRSFLAPADNTVDVETALPPRNEAAPDVNQQETQGFVQPRTLK